MTLPLIQAGFTSETTCAVATAGKLDDAVSAAANGETAEQPNWSDSSLELNLGLQVDEVPTDALPLDVVDALFGTWLARRHDARLPSRGGLVAETVRFELTEGLPPRQFSRLQP